MAQTDSWLTSNWRPLAMLSFVAMLWVIILGLAPESVMESTLLLEWLMRIIAIGLGGYVVGRSGEKMTDNYFKSKEK